MSVVHRLRFAYLQLRHRVRMRLIRSARKRHRAFLAMPFKPTDSAWPKLRDERSTITQFNQRNR